MKKLRFTIGIDEAGRGPLAGPVAVGAVIAGPDFSLKLLAGIKDSKQLSAVAREAWFKKLQAWKKAGSLSFHVALISARTIDTKGISFAIRKGIGVCLLKINADFSDCSVLLDGSLKAPPHFKNQKTIIKGDEKEPLISLASIAAKVTRDRLMVRLAKQYPAYSFEIHKGYGTKIHQKAIRKSGPSKIHRMSFLKSI